MSKSMRAGSIAGAAVALALLAAGCDPFSGPLPGDPQPSPYFIQHLEGGGTFPLEIDLGAASKNVYLTFVNPDLTDAPGSLTVSGSMTARESASGEPVSSIASGLPSAMRAPTPEAITAYNQLPIGGRALGVASLRLFEGPVMPLFDVPDVSTDTFYDWKDNPVAATCRAVVSGVDVGGGRTRTLNIWVADDCWIDGGTRLPLVDEGEGMVTALAGKFLKAGAFNDIYDWVTGMLGPEWGLHGFENLIPESGEVTILLCDIPDPPTGGTLIGYFYSRDNRLKAYEPKSNARVMFTIDAPLYATADGGTWDLTDSWPEEIYSTLAHEFQHMIHFYQRGVVLDAMGYQDDDTWINEMASLVVEDLVSSDDKLNVMGPRGVDGSDGTDGTATSTTNTNGRLPRFNYYNDLSLSAWGYDVESYSVAYAFGAWLARNYGGAALLNRLMSCALTGPAAIEDIVSQATGNREYLSRILQRWSAAQLLSNATNSPPGYQYNRGDFFDSTVNGNPYRLGSINLYNYKFGSQQGPRLYAGGTVGTSVHSSTSAALYSATPVQPVSGHQAWTLDMPRDVIATVVVR